jgi:hypothetical protein
MVSDASRKGQGVCRNVSGRDINIDGKFPTPYGRSEYEPLSTDLYWPLYQMKIYFPIQSMIILSIYSNDPRLFL